MKSLILIFATIISSGNALAAGTCDVFFSKIDTWLEDAGHLIRVVTTHTSPDNVVQYTRGYLDPSEDVEGRYDLNSAFYKNDGTVENPFQLTAGNAVLQVFKTGPDAALLNYKTPDGINTGYLMQCRDGLLYVVAGDGILTASFRFSSTN